MIAKFVKDNIDIIVVVTLGLLVTVVETFAPVFCR
jgi:hypothetical protein